MKKKNKRNLIFSAVLFCIICCISLAFFSVLEKRFLPPLQEISHMQCKSFANSIIDTVTIENLEKIDTSALLLQNGESYTANTALVNQFCTMLSSDITNKLKELPKEVIHIPLGAATKLSFFSNMGPKIPFTLQPAGAVKVDYETAFSSVGINQINYKIWLDISMEIRIVNPFYQESVSMERKLMLADLVFSGKVPEHYFQMASPSEYLLTE